MIMMFSGSDEPADYPGSNLDADLENWVKRFSAANYEESDMDSGVDEKTLLNYPGETLLPITNACTNFGGGSSNLSQYRITQEMVSLTPSSSTETLHGSGQILSSAIKSLSDQVAQSSQSQHQPLQPTQTHQNQPLLQQPQTHSLTSKITSGYQEIQIHFQKPSNKLLPCTGPMVGTQTKNLHNIQTPREQMQQNMNQNRMQLQRVNVTPGKLIAVGGQQEGNTAQPNLLAPVGFAIPSDFPSSYDYRKYVLEQILNTKEKYFNELSQMYQNARNLHATATTMEAFETYGNVKNVLEKMMNFLNISIVDSIPHNDQIVYNYMNVIVNYMRSCVKNKPRGSSQHCEPIQQPPSVGINPGVNLGSFNQNNPSRRPEVPQQSRSSSLLNNKSVQAGKDQKQENSSTVGSFKAPSFPYPPPANHKPPVANQKFDSEKRKQPMHDTNESTTLKMARRMSPPVNPTNHQTAGSSSKSDVNKMVTPGSTAESPYIISPTSSPPSGISSLSTAENQNLTAPSGCQEPQHPKDAVHHLTEVVKSITAKSLSSSLTNISTMVKVDDMIPDCAPTNLVGQNDNGPHPKMRQQLSVTSRYNDSQVWNTCLTGLSPIKKLIEVKWELLEEIKEINAKLLETTVRVVVNPAEDNINTILVGHEGTILKCLFRNVCFPDFLDSSEKMPEFGILLLVPFDYPASSTTIFKLDQSVFKEPWGKLYEEMLSRFAVLICGFRGISAVKDLARKWDASAHAVMNGYIEKLGGHSFGSSSGKWVSCIEGSSGWV